MLITAAGCTAKPPSSTVDPNTPDGSGDNDDPNAPFTVPDGMTGADIAKLILAGQRLDPSKLMSEGNIFENGSQVFRKLAAKAQSNLAASTVTLSASTSRTFSVIPLSERVDNGKGVVEIDGNFYRFSDFKENNNSYSAFENTTNGIVTMANAAADMIDDIKKNVRVVDKWVVMYGDVSYYLHVDENSELLGERSGDRISLCKRYKNEQGDDVYELYTEYNDSRYDYYQRVTYIPGKRYEFSTRQEIGSELHEDSFVADNSKGYWETYTVSNMTTHYNVSCFVMKEDIAYDSFYDPVAQTVNYLKVMSADKKTDIMHIMGELGEDVLFIDIIFAGFDGVENIEIEAKPDEIIRSEDEMQSIPSEDLSKYKLFANGDVYSIMNPEATVVNMTNGKQIRYGDTYFDGKLTVNAIRADASSATYLNGGISVRIESENYSEAFSLLNAFFREVGLVCRRDTSSTVSEIERAYRELEGFTAYYRWNGVNVSTKTGIDEAFRIERTRFGEMKAAYTEIASAPSVDFNDKELLALNVTFSPVTLDASVGIVAEGGTVTVESVTVTVTDTLLFVKNEPYAVAFALLPVNGGGLIHVGASENTATFTEGKFTLSGGITFDIPHLSNGEYNLVAYVATADGIRSTDYVLLKGDSADGETVRYGCTEITATVSEGEGLIICVTENIDVETALKVVAPVDYNTLKDAVNSEIYAYYGMPTDTLIERLDGENYVPMNGDETKVAEGKYRVRYEKLSDDGEIAEGYFNFTLSVATNGTADDITEEEINPAEPRPEEG